MDNACAYAYMSKDILSMKNLWYIAPILTVEHPEQETTSQDIV